MTDKKKVVFERKLKGDPIGYDSFGRAVVEGDIMLFAATVGQSAQMRVIKVVETLPYEKGSAMEAGGAVKFRIRRAERCWNSDTWTLQERKSIIQNLHNTYLLEDPPQELIDLFEEEEK